MISLFPRVASLNRLSNNPPTLTIHTKSWDVLRNDECERLGHYQFSILEQTGIKIAVLNAQALSRLKFVAPKKVVQETNHRMTSVKGAQGANNRF